LRLEKYFGGLRVGEAALHQQRGKGQRELQCIRERLRLCLVGRGRNPPARTRCQATASAR
jgi:hypothetical protein